MPYLHTLNQSASLNWRSLSSAASTSPSRSSLTCTFICFWRALKASMESSKSSHSTNHTTAGQVMVNVVDTVLDINSQPEGSELPSELQHPILRNTRHRLLAVYQRLFSIALLGNIVAFVTFVKSHPEPALPSLATIAIPISANLFATGLFRTEYVLNFLYTLVLWVPHTFPLDIRRRLAKVYEFRGIHSGAGSACGIWATFFLA